MAINLQLPDIQELKPRILVCGVGGAGGNAVNNMITSGLEGVDFVVANTDAQALSISKSERLIQLGINATEGLGAGSHPEVGEAAAEEVLDEIRDHLTGSHMIFITAGMGGGTGTGAAPVIARIARELGILTVGVVTKPFHFEGKRRMALADGGITQLKNYVDTLIVIPNQNLFRVANEQTTFADAFSLADQVLYSGVACITDLMVREGLINLDFADVRSVMRDGGKAMMGTGEATGETRAVEAAESAIANPLLDDVSMLGAKGALVSISGGRDLRLYEVDEAANRIREEVDSDANIIVGATFDDALEGTMRVSVVATGVDAELNAENSADEKSAIVGDLRSSLTALEGLKSDDSQSENNLSDTVRSPMHPDMKSQYQTPESLSHLASSRPARAPTAQDFAEIPSVGSVSGVEVRKSDEVAKNFARPASAPMQNTQPVSENFRDSYIPQPTQTPDAGVNRMPRTEDFPIPARTQLKASVETNQNEHGLNAQKNKVSFLERIAAVGLQKRTGGSEADFNEKEARLRSQEAQIRSQQDPHIVNQNHIKRPVHAPVSQSDLRNPDLRRVSHANIQAQKNAVEEQDLEIPAFLRRR